MKEFETLLGELASAEEVAVLQACELVVKNKEEEAIRAIEAGLSAASSQEHCFLLLQLLLNHRAGRRAG